MSEISEQEEEKKRRTSLGIAGDEKKKRKREKKNEEGEVVDRQNVKFAFVKYAPLSVMFICYIISLVVAVPRKKSPPPVPLPRILLPLHLVKRRWRRWWFAVAEALSLRKSWHEQS